MLLLLPRSGHGSRTARTQLVPCLYKYAGEPIVGSVEDLREKLKLKCSVVVLRAALKLVARCSRGVIEVKPTVWKIDPAMIDSVTDDVHFEVLPRSA